MVCAVECTLNGASRSACPLQALKELWRGKETHSVFDSRDSKKVSQTSNLTLELDTYCLTVTLLTFDFEKKC